MRHKLLVHINNNEATVKQLCEVLYLAEAKTDLTTDETCLDLVCYVKDYRLDAFLAKLSEIGGTYESFS